MTALRSGRRPSRTLRGLALAMGIALLLPVLVACSATTEFVVSVNVASVLEGEGPIPVPTVVDILLPSDEGVSLADLALPSDVGAQLTRLSVDVAGMATYTYQLAGARDASVTVTLEVFEEGTPGPASTPVVTVEDTAVVPEGVPTSISLTLEPTPTQLDDAAAALLAGGAVRVRIATDGDPGRLEALDFDAATITVGVRPGNLIF